MCLYPSTIVNPHYVKYPYELVDSYFPHDYYITIPCGKCSLCRRKKSNEWKFRLQQEIRYGTGRAFFVTFTLTDRYYARFRKNPGRAIRLFLERYRKRYCHSLRHWFATELGEENGRLHYHGIIFDPDIDAKPESFARLVLKKNGKGKYGRFLVNDGVVRRFNRWLRKLWQYGNTWVDIARPESCGYIVKYMLKPSKIDPDFMPQVFCSKGIGRSYINDPANIANHANSPITMIDGQYVCIPPYLWRKICPEEVRKEFAYRQWLDPPPFRKYLFGKEHTTQDSYDHHIDNIRRIYREVYPNVLIKTYATANPEIDLLDRTYSADLSDQYLNAVFRTLKQINYV